MTTTIVCVLRSGGPVYTPEWVWALKRGLRRHLTDYEFRVFSDLGCFGQWGTRLAHDFPGWWSKLCLFAPGLFPGRVLYLDLDTLPVGDLGELAGYSGRLAMLADFGSPQKIASGVMAWGGDEAAPIYEAFRRQERRWLQHPGQRMDLFLREVCDPVRLQDHFPGQLVSFKRHARSGIPVGARLVSFHGRPRVTELPAKHWARQAWSAM